ncbi:hypothetical protein PG990_014725 [Apiospora arundinis]
MAVVLLQGRRNDPRDRMRDLNQIPCLPAAELDQDRLQVPNVLFSVIIALRLRRRRQRDWAELNPASMGQYVARLEPPVGRERRPALLVPEARHFVRRKVPPRLWVRVRHVLDPAQAQVSALPRLAAYAQKQDAPLSTLRVRQLQQRAIYRSTGG